MKISEEQLILELEHRFNAYRKMLSEQKKLSGELVEANRKLIESEALKSHFISSITNEIINPFSSILGLSRNLLMMNDKTDSKVRNVARLIHTEAFSLDFQLRNIFTAAKIEAGELLVETSDVEVIDLAGQVAKSFQHEAECKKIDIRIEGKENITFMTDSDKLKLIISNLLSNAIKYSEQGSTILVSIGKDESGLRISVKDSGSGIDDNNRELIFDRFKRLDNNINSINTGHGLGLSIIRSLAELLEGNVDFVSKPGSGSEFILEIPESVQSNSIFNIFSDIDSDESGENEVF